MIREDDFLQCNFSTNYYRSWYQYHYLIFIRVIYSCTGKMVFLYWNDILAYERSDCGYK